MACNSCKKSNTDFVIDKNEGISITSYIVRFITFLLLFILLTPLIIPILGFVLFKVLVLQEGLNVISILKELSKKIIPAREDEDESPDLNDEYELVHYNDIIELKK